jgi:hypothetical protein
MKVLLLSDNETWETFVPESDAMIIDVHNVDEFDDIDDIEKAIRNDQFKIVNYLWDMA